MIVHSYDTAHNFNFWSHIDSKANEVGGRNSIACCFTKDREIEVCGFDNGKTLPILLEIMLDICFW